MSKVKFIVGLAMSALLLSSCGYQGQFRYPCQNPNNWETPECKPPICSATQTCPIDLIKTPLVEGPINE